MQLIFLINLELNEQHHWLVVHYFFRRIYVEGSTPTYKATYDSGS